MAPARDRDADDARRVEGTIGSQTDWLRDARRLDNYETHHLNCDSNDFLAVRSDRLCANPRVWESGGETRRRRPVDPEADE
jgi:hypothetical protein